jgi:hypothetical protein
VGWGEGGCAHKCAPHTLFSCIFVRRTLNLMHSMLTRFGYSLRPSSLTLHFLLYTQGEGYFPCVLSDNGRAPGCRVRDAAACA